MKKLVFALLLASQSAFAEEGLLDSIKGKVEEGFDKIRSIGKEKVLMCPTPGILQVELRNQESGACGHLIKKGQLTQTGSDAVRKIAEIYAKEAVKTRINEGNKMASSLVGLKKVRILKASEVADLLKQVSGSMETSEAPSVSSQVLDENLLGSEEVDLDRSEDSDKGLNKARASVRKSSDFIESIVFNSARNDFEAEEFAQSVFADRKIPDSRNLFNAQVRMFVAVETQVSSKRKKSTSGVPSEPNTRLEIFEVHTDFRLGFKGVNGKEPTQNTCEVLAVNNGSCYPDYDHRDVSEKISVNLRPLSLENEAEAQFELYHVPAQTLAHTARVVQQGSQQVFEGADELNAAKESASKSKKSSQTSGLR